MRKTRERMPISFQVTEAKLPMVQKMILSNDSWCKTISKVMTEEIRKLMETPAKRIVSMDFLCPTEAICTMIKRVINAEISANPVKPKRKVSMPNMIATAAPRDAPDDIPNIYGSQMGLRKMAWNAAPQIASAAPATMLMMMRGNRKVQMVIENSDKSSGIGSLKRLAFIR